MFFSGKNKGVTWLVVFLGNPGARYDGTRHNIGFLTADVLEKEKGIKIARLKYRALTAVCDFNGARALLMKPQTFMNLSGEAVRPACAFYRIPPERVIAVSDDVSLPAGKLRVRTKGSPGGHKGLASIAENLGTDNYPRVKIGVGAPPHPDYDMADWVLGAFSTAEAALMSEAAVKAAKAVETYIEKGPDAAMNRYNV